MLLEELTSEVQLESATIEFKARLDRQNIEGWLKTIAGFANTDGGQFYIGVEDKSHKLIGLNREEADKERNYFNNIINEHLVPRPDIKCSFLRYEVNGRELFIICASIPSSAIKPVICKINSYPAIFMRRDGFTNGATYEEIIQMSIASQKTQYDVLDSTAIFTANNFKTLACFYAAHNNGDVLTEKALASMGFFNNNKQLKQGALLFADDYNGPKTAVQCSAFSGFTKSSERIVTINRFNGNLIDAINYMLEFIKQRMNYAVIKQAEGRDEQPAYPERALFEAIINAVAHRDYFLDGTQIQLDLFKDRLEISSPGSFFQGGKIGKTYDLTNIISKRRNELICAVLIKCRVMEAAGTGFDKISEEYSHLDEQHRPYIFSSSDHFTLVLPDITYTNGVECTASLPRIEFIPPAHGSEHDERILAYCYEKARSIKEIANFLKLQDSTYFRKQIIGNLVAQNYMTKVKIGRSFIYRTNRENVRRPL